MAFPAVVPSPINLGTTHSCQDAESTNSLCYSQSRQDAKFLEVRGLASILTPVGVWERGFNSTHKRGVDSTGSELLSGVEFTGYVLPSLPSRFAVESVVSVGFSSVEVPESGTCGIAALRDHRPDPFRLRRVRRSCGRSSWAPASASRTRPAACRVTIGYHHRGSPMPKRTGVSLLGRFF